MIELSCGLVSFFGNSLKERVEVDDKLKKIIINGHDSHYKQVLLQSFDGHLREI